MWSQELQCEIVREEELYKVLGPAWRIIFFIGPCNLTLQDYNVCTREFNFLIVI